jgi:hypothetical protein
MGSSDFEKVALAQGYSSALTPACSAEQGKARETFVLARTCPKLARERLLRVSMLARPESFSPESFLISDAYRESCTFLGADSGNTS